MRVCLVALNALPAIDPAVSGPIGGIETRSWQLARGLARAGDVQVQFVVRHTSSLKQTSREDVTITTLVDPLYPLWQQVGQSVARQPRFPWLTIRQWHARLLWQLPRLAIDRLWRGRVYSSDRPDQKLIQLNADLYGTFGVQTHSAVVIQSAKAARKPSVLFLGSDGDLDPIFEPGGSGTDPYGTPAATGRQILATADQIIVQTQTQQQRLQERFGRTSFLLPSPIDVDNWDRAGTTPLLLPELNGLDRFVLWVGRAEELHKRPQLCVDLARRLPDVQFLMILNRRDPDVEARIRATAPENLRILSRVAPDHMPALFARAAVFLNTSQLEGFPNVFLQAAISGVPIVSLEVGEEFLQQSRAGLFAGGNMTTLAAQVHQQWTGTTATAIDHIQARRFVIERHALDRVIEPLRHHLQKLIESAPPPG